MQFVIIAHDFNDALERRLAVREKHVALGDQKKADGNYLYGVAMLNENGEMKGSIMIVDYPSRKEIDEWLKIEPYMTGKVWETVEIIPCNIGPTFTK